MVSKKYVEDQLKKIGFKPNGWGKGEVNELPNIILEDEEIYECVNGIYDGGFALLIATDIRVLLVDQKPLNYLTVEDLRFDMISEMDYSHRLFGARISISSGEKNLKFLSYNQPRLRKLIGHVQHCMAMTKKKQSSHAEGQVQHLEKINEQLQEYLLAQQKQQNRLQKQLEQVATGKAEKFDHEEPVKPSPELADYLFAQSLLSQHREEAGKSEEEQQPAIEVQATSEEQQPVMNSDIQDLYEEGLREVFGKHMSQQSDDESKSDPQHKAPLHLKALEINPIYIAYSKLPMALRNRKFGRPSIRAHILPLHNLKKEKEETVSTQATNAASVTQS